MVEKAMSKNVCIACGVAKDCFKAGIKVISLAVLIIIISALSAIAVFVIENAEMMKEALRLLGGLLALCLVYSIALEVIECYRKHKARCNP